jgi:hypothetical protein
MKILKRDVTGLIEEWLFRDKIVILYGARQVGKTTLVKELLKKIDSQDGYYNCELLQVKQLLERQDVAEIMRVFGGTKLIVLDEAQKIANIGLILKVLHDTFPEIQIIATGSSSFTLSSQIQEPLTGRALEFVLYPFSYAEMRQINRPIDLPGQIPAFLRFGLYPEIVGKSESDSIFLLNNLTSKYLFKDVFEFETIKKPDIIVHLLQSLAFQIGCEVSHHELSNLLNVHVKTVQRYLELLEKAFVIYRLKPLSRNLRSEISKKEKIYFYDLGIRNSLINNYNTIELRDDIGSMWENFCIIERLKSLQIQKKSRRVYFWRTHDQKEIDYVEEENGKWFGFEFKWNPKAKVKNSSLFQKEYNASVTIIHRNNVDAFLLNDITI